MKKFLLVVTLVGVVISQIFFSSVAEAYAEGDRMIIAVYRCYSCGAICRYITVNDSLVKNEMRNFSDDHCFRLKAEFWYYYQNGQWVETYRHYYEN
ncbi:MAG: hypothetical protein SR1Q5_08130 [Quinella sp. 1Q5]|nr:hypothetical protein [Quinella sp. 1Q5]